VFKFFVVGAKGGEMHTKSATTYGDFYSFDFSRRGAVGALGKANLEQRPDIPSGSYMLV